VRFLLNDHFYADSILLLNRISWDCAYRHSIIYLWNILRACLTLIWYLKKNCRYPRITLGGEFTGGAGFTMSRSSIRTSELFDWFLYLTCVYVNVYLSQVKLLSTMRQFQIRQFEHYWLLMMLRNVRFSNQTKYITVRFEYRTKGSEIRIEFVLRYPIFCYNSNNFDFKYLYYLSYELIINYLS